MFVLDKFWSSLLLFDELFLEYFDFADDDEDEEEFWEIDVDSLSCALFVLLVLLLCLSFSLELLDDELVLAEDEEPDTKPLEAEVDVDEGWLLPLLAVLLFEVFCVLESWLGPVELSEFEFFDALLDLRCFDGGSVVCRDDEDDDEAFDKASVSFSGDEGASLECSAWLMGLYGGIGLTLPPFFYDKIFVKNCP